MSRLLQVGVVQQANTGNRTSNLEKSANEARKCKAEGAELIVFQELHTSLYFCQTENTEVFDQAETIPGPGTEYFGKLALELNCVLVISLFEQRAPGLCHNTAVVMERDGTIAGKYRKMHIPDDPAYYVNRTGFEPDPSGVTKGIQFWGSSFVAGPQGEYLWRAPENEEVSAVVAIDRARTADVRRIWPFFRDRRIDAYDGLTKRYLD